MVTTVDKKDFNTGFIRKMTPGMEAQVVCKLRREMNAARSLVWNYAKLYPEMMSERGIAAYKTEQVGDTYLKVVAVPEE